MREARREAVQEAEMRDAKVVVVTGTSKGFGREIALELWRRGHTVVGTARREADLDALRSAAPGIEGALFDVTDFAGVRQALAEVEARHGRIDALINNAGYGLYGPVEALDEAEILRQSTRWGPGGRARRCCPACAGVAGA